MVQSNFSTRPRWEQAFRSSRAPIQRPSSSSSRTFPVLKGHPFSLGAAMRALVDWGAPLVSRNLRERSAMVRPRQVMRRRGSSVTRATTVASRFSSAASRIRASTSPGETTRAMRSWLSAMASSVPSRPSYFLGTTSRSMTSPSASSPMATLTPPAPKSLHFLMSRQVSGRRKSRWSLRSIGGSPFCTSAPHFSMLCSVWALELPVAPPMPSRPVRPPTSTTTSPGTGSSRRTWARGTAPTTAPISMRLAT